MGQRRTKLPRRQQLVARTETSNVRERPRHVRSRASKQQQDSGKHAQKYGYSASLFADPSFLRGIARLFDLSGSLSSRLDGLTPDEIDMLAVLADYQAIWEDHQGTQRHMRQLGLWDNFVA